MAATPVRTFNLRLSDDEFAKVVAKANQLGLSRAGLIRRLLERAGVLEGSPDQSKPKAKKRQSEPSARTTTSPATRPAFAGSNLKKGQ